MSDYTPEVAQNTVARVMSHCVVRSTPSADKDQRKKSAMAYRRRSITHLKLFSIVKDTE